MPRQLLFIVCHLDDFSFSVITDRLLYVSQAVASSTLGHGATDVYRPDNCYFVFHSGGFWVTSRYPPTNHRYYSWGSSSSSWRSLRNDRLRSFNPMLPAFFLGPKNARYPGPAWNRVRRSMRYSRSPLPFFYSCRSSGSLGSSWVGIFMPDGLLLFSSSLVQVYTSEVHWDAWGSSVLDVSRPDDSWLSRVLSFWVSNNQLFQGKSDWDFIFRLDP